MIYIQKTTSLFSKTLLKNVISAKYSISGAGNMQLKYYDRELLPRLKIASASDQNPRAWVENLQADQLEPLGYIDLHPDVFSVHPRIDLVHKNLKWQANYRVVDWRCITTRADLPYRSRAKPWPQKGTGRARHANRRNQIWVGGAQYAGPRGPHSFFSMLPRCQRIKGLLSMLTIKHVQNDLRIVETLELDPKIETEAKNLLLKDSSDLLNAESSSDVAEFGTNFNIREQLIDRFSLKAASYLRDFVDSQDWGPAVLFITDETMSLPDLVTETADQVWQLNEDALPSDLSIRLACNSYSKFVEKEQSPISAAIPVPAGSPTPAPRAIHPARGLTIMPLSGLNVWSMVHHDTLVLTLSALNQLEERLLTAQRISIRDSSEIDSTPIKREPDWQFDKDWSEDDTSPYDIELERHFTGSVNELADLKKQLS